MSKSIIRGKYLDRKDSDTYYGKEIPYHFQDDMTKDILRSASMRPEEALALADEEHKSIKASINQERESNGDYMQQIRNLDRGTRLVEQTERSAKLYGRYSERNKKRKTPDKVSEMVRYISSTRDNKGGKNKTRKNKRKTRKNKKRYHKRH
jgi:hypothetical protein